MLSTSVLYGCNGSEKATNVSGTDVKNEIKEEPKNNEQKVVDTSVKSADEAINLLKEGNERFTNDKSELRNINKEKRQDLEDGQNPYAIVVSCSDSRVTPSAVFNAGLGEIFDIRLAGNVVDDNALGSIEYAVEHLHTPLVVVVGHEKCGAVTAAHESVVNKSAVEGKLSTIVDKIKPNVDEKGTIDDAIEKNVDSVVSEISNNEIVKHLIDEGKVKVVGAHYTLDGKVVFE